MHELRVGENGYGFPEENVCLLTDEEATTERVKEAFESTLVERARKENFRLSANLWLNIPAP